MISPEVTAIRASAIVALLHALQNYEGTPVTVLLWHDGQPLLFTVEDSDTRTVSLFYTESLAQAVGPTYKAPNLAVLALQWLRAEGMSGSF